MKYCKQCKIYIKDSTSICPLCQNVLEKNVSKRMAQADSETEKKPEENGMMLQEPEKGTKDMYPDVSLPREKFRRLYRSCVFVAVLTMLLLGFINYKTYSPDFTMKWALISDVSIFYLLMTFRYFLFHAQGQSNTKASFQILGAMAICILVDYVTGFGGWSVDYAVPSIILLVDVALMILMIANNREWEKYIILQVIMVFLSVCNLLLKIPHLRRHPLFCVISCVISVILFLGTCVIGGRKAKAELGRRFHI